MMRGGGFCRRLFCFGSLVADYLIILTTARKYDIIPLYKTEGEINMLTVGFVYSEVLALCGVANATEIRQRLYEAAHFGVYVVGLSVTTHLQQLEVTLSNGKVIKYKTYC